MEHEKMTLLEDFLHDTISPADFDHKSHVQVGFEVLKRHDFIHAHAAYVTHLKDLTRRAGMESKFNATITFAAMSRIAERVAGHEDEDWDEFIARNPDLLRASTLTAGYAPSRLTTPLARAIPLLPE